MKTNLSSGRDALKACLDASKARSPEGVACVPAAQFETFTKSEWLAMPLIFPSICLNQLGKLNAFL